MIKEFQHGAYMYTPVCIQHGRRLWKRSSQTASQQRYTRINAKRREVIKAFSS